MTRESAELTRLRERYQVLFGVAQGLNVATFIGSVLSWGEAPWRVVVGMVIASWLGMGVWRFWGWVPYRDAMDRDLAESMAELEALVAKWQ